MGSAADGLSKPSDLSEVQALNDKVLAFDKTCLNYLKVLDAAKAAAEKMTTHKEADEEVAGPRERTSSPWRRWSPPWESSRTSSSRRRSWWRTCRKTIHLNFVFISAIYVKFPNVACTQCTVLVLLCSFLNI